MINDWILLQRYAKEGAEDAFEQLVFRHMNFVYSQALRRVRDTHCAEEVAQAVFILLARKAAELKPGRALTAWLYETTRMTALNALKLRANRSEHQIEINAMDENTPKAAPQSSEAVTALLEDGLATLDPHERDVIFLHYYQQLSMSEIGATLRISVDAAKKRSSRGLERLREFFTMNDVTIPTVAIGALFANLAANSAPPALLSAAATQSLLFAAKGGTASALAGSQQLVSMTVVKTGGLSMIHAGVISAVLAITGTVAWQFVPVRPTGGETRAEAPLPAPAPTAAALAPARGVAKGWPVVLPSSPVGCPTPVRLSDPKRTSIVIPAMQGEHSTLPLLHEKPELAAKVFVFQPDGSPLKGWPFLLSTEEMRAQERTKDFYGATRWRSHPSVMDTDGDGFEEFVVTAPDRSINLWKVFVFDRFGVRAHRHGVGHNMSIPLVDINEDGEMDIVHPEFVSGIGCGPQLVAWPADRNVRMGYAPAIADMRGDGQLNCYFPRHFIVAKNQLGVSLKGWPELVDPEETRHPPALGDLDGDGTLEVVALNGKGVLQIWQWDGKPFKGTKPDTARNLTAIFKDNLGSSCTPTLVDLDGDKSCEIIVYDNTRMALCAWKSDGSGFFQPDGIIAELNQAQVIPLVAVASLENTDVLDFFCGTSWIRRKPAGTAEVINLLQGQAPGKNRMGHTLTDTDGDGYVEVLFGLTDGRVFRYETGLPYDSKRILWGTPLANLRRTCSLRIPAFTPSDKVRAAARTTGEQMTKQAIPAEKPKGTSNDAAKPPAPPREF